MIEDITTTTTCPFCAANLRKSQYCAASYTCENWNDNCQFSCTYIPFSSSWKDNNSPFWFLLEQNQLKIYLREQYQDGTYGNRNLSKEYEQPISKDFSLQDFAIFTKDYLALQLFR
jgi:hypothetical protein